MFLVTCMTTKEIGAILTEERSMTSLFANTDLSNSDDALKPKSGSFGSGAGLF